MIESSMIWEKTDAGVIFQSSQVSFAWPMCWMVGESLAAAPTVF